MKTHSWETDTFFDFSLPIFSNDVFRWLLFLKTIKNVREISNPDKKKFAEKVHRFWLTAVIASFFLVSFAHSSGRAVLAIQNTTCHSGIYLHKIMHFIGIFFFRNHIVFCLHTTHFVVDLQFYYCAIHRTNIFRMYQFGMNKKRTLENKNKIIHRHSK